MKTWVISLWLLCLASVVSQAAIAGLKPKSKTVTLKEFTELEVDVLPDLAVQFVFPFVLDSPKHKPAFTHRLTNQSIYDLGDVKQEFKGQNTLAVTVKKPGEGGRQFVEHTHIGNLLINVDGYHVTVLLRTTTNPKKHVTNIIFKPTKKQRKYLIQKEVEFIRKAEHEAYKKKLAKLDDLAQDKAMAQIGHVALADLDQVRIKYDQDVTLDNNEEITIYVEKLLDYRKYVLLKFYVENKSNTNLKVTHIDVSGQLDNGNRKSFNTAMLCEGLIRAGTDKPCVITTRDRSLVSAKSMQLSFTTNRGAFAVKW